MDETNSALPPLKQMARWLYKYNHLCDVWDQKKIGIKGYSERMTDLEWKINSLVHELQSSIVPIQVIFYRNMDAKRIQFFYNGKEVNEQVFSALFM